MTQYAVFSKTMLKSFMDHRFFDHISRYGSIYSSKNGDVHVTAVGSSKNAGCLHDDLEYLGEVDKWLRFATLEEAQAALVR